MREKQAREKEEPETALVWEKVRELEPELVRVPAPAPERRTRL
ncbi:MAG: hypothetical protein Q8O16_06960 [Dehalococcoidia bacterium]|nr:hypothetical protein [Dehalococcoidia bacterium]